jgi:hypothetical protein
LRRSGTLLLALAALMTTALPASAHGLGGRADLPIPLGMFLAGASVVLILSFAALAVLWPRHRWQEEAPARPLRIPGFTGTQAVLRLFGVIVLVFVIATGVFGVNNASRNPAPVLLWVGFWLVVPFASAIFGDLYRFLNPFPTLARWLKLGGEDRPEFTVTNGLYPAAGVLLAFVWVETVYPEPAAPRTVAIMALVYLVAMLVSIERLGPGTTLRSVDGFAVYNRLFSRIAPFTRMPDGRPAWRGWLRGLATLDEVPGISLFLVVMVGTVTYDGISETPWFRDLFGSFATSIAGGTVLLVATVALIGMGYAGACLAAARIAGDGWTTERVADRFAHTLVPIALAYAVAHYFTLILFEGQRIISSMSDPFGTGLDLFGTADRPIDFTLISPTGVWYVQLGVIVAGHVAAVFLAHDRALYDFDESVAVRTQYAMLALMVVLTGIGLAILAAG